MKEKSGRCEGDLQRLKLPGGHMMVHSSGVPASLGEVW